VHGYRIRERRTVRAEGVQAVTAISVGVAPRRAPRPVCGGEARSGPGRPGCRDAARPGRRVSQGSAERHPVAPRPT
jgi:hypothetical protein